MRLLLILLIHSLFALPATESEYRFMTAREKKMIGFSYSQSLNDSIVANLLSKQNAKIGNGICRTLIIRVLEEEGATIYAKDTVSHPVPGDIFITHGFYEETDMVTYGILTGMDRHIAFVYKVLGNDKFLIIDQNAQGKRKASKVTIREIDLSIKNNTVNYGYYFIRPVRGLIDKGTKDLIKNMTNLP